MLSESNKQTILILPPDVLHIIFGTLKSDLHPLGCVCKNFRSIVTAILYNNLNSNTTTNLLEIPRNFLLFHHSQSPLPLEKIEYASEYENLKNPFLVEVISNAVRSEYMSNSKYVDGLVNLHKAKALSPEKRCNWRSSHGQQRAYIYRIADDLTVSPSLILKWFELVQINDNILPLFNVWLRRALRTNLRKEVNWIKSATENEFRLICRYGDCIYPNNRMHTDWNEREYYFVPFYLVMRHFCEYGMSAELKTYCSLWEDYFRQLRAPGYYGHRYPNLEIENFLFAIFRVGELQLLKDTIERVLGPTSAWSGAERILLYEKGKDAVDFVVFLCQKSVFTFDRLFSTAFKFMVVANPDMIDHIIASLQSDEKFSDQTLQNDRLFEDVRIEIVERYHRGLDQHEKMLIARARQYLDDKNRQVDKSYAFVQFQKHQIGKIARIRVWTAGVDNYLKRGEIERMIWVDNISLILKDLFK